MTGVILEIASGSGDHIVHFAKNFAALVFQPSDPEPDPLLSIAAWMKATGVTNVRAPIALAGVTFGWPIASANGYNRSDTEQLRIRPEPAGARTRDELCVPGAGAGTFAPCSAVQIERHNGRVRRSQALRSALPDPDTIPWVFSGPDELMALSGLPCAA